MTPYTDEAAAALANWGASPQMNPIETVMWRSEVEPKLRSTICGVEILDQPPDWDRLVAAHQWGVKAIPRARQKVVESPLGLAPPSWVEDTEFDLSNHLRRVTLPAPGTMRDLLDLAQTIAMTPFDRARPPWEMTVVEGLEGGRAAYIGKMHHSTTDGLGSMQLIALGRSRQREHTPHKPVAPEAASAANASAPQPAQIIANQVQRALLDAPKSLARGVAGAAGLARQLLTDPQTPFEDALRSVSSLQRMLGQSPAPGSPLLAARGLSWRFEAHAVPLTDLKVAAKAAEGSLNDAYIAALLGAFRLYHEHFGVPIEWMPIAFPISLRKGDDPMGGNRFAGARFAGPVGEADPAERIRLVRKFALTAREEPAVAALDRLSVALARVPTPVLTRVMLGIGRANDLQASNVPGVPFPVYLAGARVTHMYPFGPLPGCAAMVAMVSHDGTCCIGANLDAAAITDPAVFGECLAEGVDEVLALGRPRARRKKAS